MKYALLAYNTEQKQRAPISPELAELLAQPRVTSWARLYEADSATTLSKFDGKTVLTDGPFVDSKEYLGGLIIIEADNLDEALAFAAKLGETRIDGSIEVRPIFEES